MYLHIFLFYLLFFLLSWFSKILSFITMLSVSRTLFSLFFRVSLLAQTLLIFLHLRISCFPLKLFFFFFLILGFLLTVLFLQHLNYVVLLLSNLHSFWGEICSHLNHLFLRVSCHFSLVASKIFLFVFSFWNLIMICLTWFLWVYSLCLASWVCRFTYFAKFVEISAIISFNTFQSNPLSLLPLGLRWHRYQTFGVFPQAPEHSLFFFTLFSLC